jgi:hypothetical protein
MDKLKAMLIIVGTLFIGFTVYKVLDNVQTMINEDAITKKEKQVDYEKSRQYFEIHRCCLCGKTLKVGTEQKDWMYFNYFYQGDETKYCHSKCWLKFEDFQINEYKKIQQEGK